MFKSERGLNFGCIFFHIVGTKVNFFPFQSCQKSHLICVLMHEVLYKLVLVTVKKSSAI